MKTKIALILFPLCISMVLLSCGPTSENAKKYDDELVDQLTKVYKKEALLIDAISKKSPGSLDTLYANLKKQIKLSNEDVTNMGTFDGRSDLKNAALRVFMAYNDVIPTKYKDLIALSKIPDDVYTPMDDDKKIALFKEIDESINKANEEFKQLERDFISKYKIELFSGVKDSTSLKK